MSELVLDTHAWYITNPARLSPFALQAIRAAASAGQRCFVPSVCVVEGTYLAEKGKIPRGDYDQLIDVFEVRDSNVVLCPLDLLVARAVARIPRSSVPDLPDRVIAATALALNLPLVTRDEKIRALPIQTIW